MCWLRMTFWLWLALAPSALTGAPAKIIKVLPQYLDKEGRHTLSPSLYERDAYQAYLRRNPALCSGLRYDVEWKAKRSIRGPLKMRLELRTAKQDRLKPFMIEQPVKWQGWLGHWTALVIQGDNFKSMGKILAWRVSLWQDSRLLAEQKSFLWSAQAAAQ